jgi:hypothetical protein
MPRRTTEERTCRISAHRVVRSRKTRCFARDLRLIRLKGP